jgi:DNA-directed RNA polymerase specialized sigma subunit
MNQQPQPQPQAPTPHRPQTHAVATPARPRRHRPVNPHAAANALALQHRDIAATVACNISRRTGHPKEDLEQIAMLGILQAARRYSPERGSFRPYARTYANGEVYHYLRDKGFLIKVPASWRELHARGQKLVRLGTAAAEVPERLGVSAERWREIVQACEQRVVAFEVREE